MRVDWLDAGIENEFGPCASGKLLKQDRVVARQLPDFGVGFVVVLGPVDNADLALTRWRQAS